MQIKYNLNMLPRNFLSIVLFNWLDGSFDYLMSFIYFWFFEKLSLSLSLPLYFQFRSILTIGGFSHSFLVPQLHLTLKHFTRRIHILATCNQSSSSSRGTHYAFSPLARTGHYTHTHTHTKVYVWYKLDILVLH